VQRNGSTFVSILGVAGCVTCPWIAHAVSRPPIALRRLRLVNAHTGETFDGAYRDDKGPIEGVIYEFCTFLRDHHSGCFRLERIAGWASHPLESAALSRRIPKADISHVVE